MTASDMVARRVKVIRVVAAEATAVLLVNIQGSHFAGATADTVKQAVQVVKC